MPSLRIPFPSQFGFLGLQMDEGSVLLPSPTRGSCTLPTPARPARAGASGSDGSARLEGLSKGKI